MIVQLLTEHHLEFLILKGGCKGSCESTLVKMPHCWKSHVMAQLQYPVNISDVPIPMQQPRMPVVPIHSSPMDCKFYPNCHNMNCPFNHPKVNSHHSWIVNFTLTVTT